jgi:DNA polymerase III delta prime subunit
MRKHNPFTPGFGEEPPHLAGREIEQNTLTETLHRMIDRGKGRSIVMYGPRGTGKTVLLNWLEDECNKEGVVPIKATPARKLRSIEDLPELLLPENKLRPGKVVAGIGPVKAEWDMGSPASMAKLESSLIDECRSTPRVLLLDEAHNLKPDTCQDLLTLAQEVAGKAPFLLVLAGTPGLHPLLMSVGATFVEGSQMMGIGRLDEKGAAEAISKPLQQDGISIEENALSRVVADAQLYPYFLQLWGRALWDVAAERDADRLTDADMERAMSSIQAERNRFYTSRYLTMLDDEALLIAADAVADAFQDRESINVDWLPEIIERALPDERGRRDKASRLSKKLQRIDYVWSPPGSIIAEPGIPSFMTFIQSSLEVRRRGEEELFPAAKRNDSDFDFER